MLRRRVPEHLCDAGSGWPGRAAQWEAGGGEALGGVARLEAHLEGDRRLGQREARRMGGREEEPGRVAERSDLDLFQTQEIQIPR